MDRIQQDKKGVWHRLTVAGGTESICGITFLRGERREWLNSHNMVRCPDCFDGVFTFDANRIEGDRYEQLGYWYIRRGEASKLDLAIRLASIACSTCLHNGDPCLGGDRLCETEDGSCHPTRPHWKPLAQMYPSDNRARLRAIIRIAEDELNALLRCER